MAEPPPTPPADEEGELEGSAKEKGSRRRRSSDWEINPEELKMVETIGHGSTSHVYSAMLRGHMVAVKEIAEVDDSTHLAVGRELQVMTRTDHPHVLRFVGLVSLTSPLRMCLELCAGGTLFDLLHNCWDIPISWPQRFKVLVDISQAMTYLHGFRKQIIHRDLKSLNIFLTQPVVDENSVPDCKIADFGFARVREHVAGPTKDWPTLTRGAGSMHWMAPEVYSGTAYHAKADIFSFSIVTYEVICRHMAFEDLDPDTAGEQISLGTRPTTDASVVPPDTPPELMDLMLRCWDQEPTNRPDFIDIVPALEAMAASC
jgi:serine/threonine protein kinase